MVVCLPVRHSTRVDLKSTLIMIIILSAHICIHLKNLRDNNINDTWKLLIY